MADTSSMVHLLCLFMKMHLLALLQDNCLVLVCSAFLHKVSAYVRNIPHQRENVAFKCLNYITAST